MNFWPDKLNCWYEPRVLIALFFPNALSDVLTDLRLGSLRGYSATLRDEMSGECRKL